MQKQLDKSPEFIAQLEAAKKALLTQAVLQNFIKANPVTDAEIKAEYDSKVAAEKGTEYKARHILVKTEAEAKKLIAELDKGADFAKLANKNSLDAKESQNGGDLGWFSAAQMVAPFSEAVAALEKGKYTKEPVKTQFGYHVILKEDSRPVTPPPLEAVKEQLTPFMQRKKVQGMIETLRNQAKVEVLVPLTEEKPKTEAAPAESATPTPACSKHQLKKNLPKLLKSLLNPKNQLKLQNRHLRSSRNKKISITLLQKRADYPPFFYTIFSRYCTISCTLRFPLNSLMSSL